MQAHPDRQRKGLDDLLVRVGLSLQHSSLVGELPICSSL